jgi:hypothetical protein
MTSWGSVPEWLEVLFAFIAFLGFVKVEREKLATAKGTVSGDSMGSASSPDNEVNHGSLTELYVGARAGLYSRILIGIVFGIALGSIYSWVLAGSFQDGEPPSYATKLTMEYAALAASAIALSTFLSLVFFHAGASWTSMFVHWTERLIFSFLGFGVIFLFAWIGNDYQAKTYYLYSDFLINVLMSSLLFLLIGFRSTPVDRLTVLVNQSLAGRH